MANGTWKIARRGNAQLPLVIIIALAIVLVLLGKSQPGLFDAARTRITDWMAPALSAVRAPLDGAERWAGSIGQIFRVYEENLQLKEENARLRQWRNMSVVLEGRVRHYEKLLNAVPDPALNAVLARVIGRSSRPFLRTMILDAGTTNGARAGQAVMDASGMIGRLYLTGQRTSWVILLTDINSRVPVSIAPARVQAVLAGDNSPSPRLDQLGPNVRVKPGDQVVSSGDGGLVPAGLPIGTVVADGTGFRVVLLADSAQSENVEILNYARPREEMPALPTLPAEAAGVKPYVPPPPPAMAASAPVLPSAPKPKPLPMPALSQAASPDAGVE
jgi:rod shape-determining protein MreC